mmetsp:Transcript_26713/g.54823  ORF Transcript_26713/g.54823 Transcript_26713/m.54823 type:complete len:80 (-) Transcript_26713:756-995(-)
MLYCVPCCNKRMGTVEHFVFNDRIPQDFTTREKFRPKNTCHPHEPEWDHSSKNDYFVLQYLVNGHGTFQQTIRTRRFSE